jgi:hypothetical protein
MEGRIMVDRNTMGENGGIWVGRNMEGGRWVGSWV